MTTFDVMCALTTVAISAYGLGMLLPGYAMYANFFFKPDLWNRLMSKFDRDDELQTLFWVLIWGGIGLTWISWGLVMFSITMWGIDYKKEFSALNVGIWVYWLGIYAYIRNKDFWTAHANIVNIILTLGMIGGWAAALSEES